MRRFHTGILFLAVLGSTLSAQSPPRPLEFPRDSALFTALRQAVLPVLRKEMEWLDSTLGRRPLRFRTSRDGVSPKWTAFEQEIHDSLNTRSVIALDRHAGYLAIGGALLRDSLFEGYVSIGTEFFCGTDQGGGATGYTIRAVRGADGTWPRLFLKENTPNHGSCLAETVKPEKMPGGAARMAWIRERYRCPTSVPHVWVAVDKSLGKGFSCSLVVMATEVVSGAPANAQVSAFDPQQPVCVRLRATSLKGWDSTATFGPGNWEVAFYDRNNSGIRVSIDVVSGEVRRFPVGASEGWQLKPPCSR